MSTVSGGPRAVVARMGDAYNRSVTCQTRLTVLLELIPVGIFYEGMLSTQGSGLDLQGHPAQLSPNRSVMITVICFLGYLMRAVQCCMYRALPFGFDIDPLSVMRGRLYRARLV